MGKVLLSTQNDIPGFEVVDVVGIAQGNIARMISDVGDKTWRDIFSIKTYAGGEINGYTQAIAEARDQALDRMREDADSKDADAVIGVRIETSLSLNRAKDTNEQKGIAEIHVYGTAVRLRHL